MKIDGEVQGSTRERIAELEAELASESEGMRTEIADLERQIAEARVNDADLKAQLERSAAATRDLERQLEESAAVTRDLLQQLEVSRIERLHLVERLGRDAALGRRWWARLFSRARPVAPIPPRMARARRRIARRLLRGSGLEIGALNCPIPVKRGVRVRYVDRKPTADLRREYVEWSHASFVEVDLVEDGEVLGRVPDASQDFVIASHVLEHCENPIGTVRRHLAKIRPGGRLLYIVPDRRGGFDADRPLTTFEHVLRDDREGPAGSRWDHYLEFSRLANRSPEDQAEAIARQMMDAGASIHFHVWEDTTFREFLDRTAELLGGAFDVEHFARSYSEVIVVLRKRA